MMLKLDLDKEKERILNEDISDWGKYHTIVVEGSLRGSGFMALMKLMTLKVRLVVYTDSIPNMGLLGRQLLRHAEVYVGKMKVPLVLEAKDENEIGIELVKKVRVK